MNSQATARNTPLPADVFLQTISDALVKTIESDPRVINIIEGEDWRAPIMAYFCHYYGPDSAVEQMRMQQRAQSYQIVDNDVSNIFVSQAPSVVMSAKKKVIKYYRRFMQEYVEVILEPEL
jgi:hypothetical protein